MIQSPPACRRWLLVTLLMAKILDPRSSASAFTPTRTRTGRIAVSRGTFRNPTTSTRPRRRVPTSELNLIPNGDLITTGTTVWTCAVEVFDGSQIVDPVVVSGAFWGSLQTKIVSLVIGQILAAAVFSILLTVFATQMSKLASFVSGQIFKDNNQQQQGIKIPPELRDKSTLVQPDFVKLLACIAIDIVGSSSELIPVFGEVTDIVWAPIAGILLRQLYGSNLLLGLEFVEEILPLTDVLPLCTLCWVVDTFFGDSQVAKILQLGQYSSQRRNDLSTMDAIDVERRDDSKR